MTAISGELDGFRENLTFLTERIRAVLPQEYTNTKGQNGAWETPDKSVLSRLKTAVETEDIGLIDRILNDLGHLSESTESGKTLTAVADHVLMSEFREAAAFLSDLIGGTRE
jgi:hypothetical protein